MGQIMTALNDAAGAAETKWSRFNKDAHLLFDRLIDEGWIKRYEIRNYIPGKMDVFFLFKTERLSKDYDAQREISREFHRMFLSYGITDDDMAFDNQMGMRYVTEEDFERRERNTREWVDMI